MSRIRPRTHARFRVSLPARFRAAGTFQWSEGQLVNLSRGGLSLQSKASLANGQELELEIGTVDGEGQDRKRRLAAVVQWKRGQRYGLRFVSKRDAGKTR